MIVEQGMEYLRAGRVRVCERYKTSREITMTSEKKSERHNPKVNLF